MQPLERRRAYGRLWRKKWRDKNHAKAIRYERRWRAKNRDKCNEAARRLGVNLKKEVIAAYGGKCVCCGNRNYEFLTIGHTNGNGNKHRRSIGESSGRGFYRWLKRNGFPKDGFELQCMNCNCSLFWFGYCPHQREPMADRASRQEVLEPRRAPVGKGV